MAKGKMKPLDLLMFWLVTIGALVWLVYGLTGLFGTAPINLVQKILGTMPTIEYLVYTVVGIAGVIGAFKVLTK